MLEVGDIVIVISEDDPKVGSWQTITHVDDTFAYTSPYVGYWRTSMAGRLASEDGRPYVRKLTPLDKAMK